MSRTLLYLNKINRLCGEIPVRALAGWKAIPAIMVAGMVFVGFSMVLVLLVIELSGPESSKERRLRSEIMELEINYETLGKKVASMQQEMNSIENRDDQVYRQVLGAEPIDQAVRKAGVGGADRYQDIRDKRLTHSDLIIEMYTRVDRLRRKLYIESISQDHLLQLSAERWKIFASIPSIQPISNKTITAVASGFGMRFHPFYRALAMHTGIDFAAPEGSRVFATADGEVVAADTAVYGYGKLIVIDHGNHYVTRYAHLSAFTVKPGKRVRRGEQIGLVGNTGMSTASHLHYEVLVNGIPVNPVYYFFRDLNSGDYERITQLASSPQQSMGN